MTALLDGVFYLLGHAGTPKMMRADLALRIAHAASARPDVAGFLNDALRSTSGLEEALDMETPLRTRMDPRLFPEGGE